MNFVLKKTKIAYCRRSAIGVYVLQEILVDAALGAVGILEVSGSVMQCHSSCSRSMLRFCAASCRVASA